MCLGDFNGHIRRRIHGFCGVHGGSPEVAVEVLFYPFVSPNKGDGWNYLIIIEIGLTLNPPLERLLASLSFSQTFLLRSTAAFSQVFLGRPPFSRQFHLEI